MIKISKKLKVSPSNTHNLLLKAKSIFEKIEDNAFKINKETRNVHAQKLLNLRQRIIDRQYQENLNKVSLTLNKKLEELENLKQSLTVKNKEESLELAILITKDLTGKEVSNSSEVMSNQIQKAIYELENKKIFKILVNKKDFKLIDKNFSSHYKVESNDEIEKGKAKLETAHGYINIDWEVKLSSIKNMLFELMKNEK